MIGQTFNRLTVIAYRGVNSDRKKIWLCRCCCGNETIVSGKSLRTGNTKSCGCYQKSVTSEMRLVHGLSHTRLYGIWLQMKRRCHNVQDTAYQYYGGRGIVVCPEWNNDFLVFYDWAIHNGYGPGLTIDRYPNKDGNYEPGNVRWATMSEQGRNRKSTVLSEKDVKNIRADTRSPAVIANEYGVTRSCIYSVIKNKTWKDI